MKAHPKAGGRFPATTLSPDKKSALLLGDIQVDFCPGGPLAVPGGDEIIPAVNEYIRLFHAKGLPVVATRDWHPPDHCSFREQGGPWPPHCLQGSRGAQFHPALVLPQGTLIISKATDPKKEAYSSFEGTSLEERLRDLGVETLYVSGLATDYCVKHTVLDARRLGLRVVLLEDAIRGIDVAAGDSERAIVAVREAGAVCATARDVGLTGP